ncbi:alpha/beta hydrolase [Emcibacter sp.]|uniref:alpha/beta hydrolase n=1 Tax=Emcibacter sp. TaxID=1979954 RepID=UPI002AA6B2F7|nr:alpha/beta hydrolase [Emcibacter sp.]
MSETREKDPVLAELIGALRAGDLSFEDPPAKLRADFEVTLSQIPVAEDLSFENVKLGDVSALLSTSPGAAGDAALLYLHGGGFIGGSAQGYRGLSAELGRAIGVGAYSLDYRLAPEDVFPAAVEDAASAYQALLDKGFSPDRIVVAGDSAGGGLVMSLLVKLRDAGAPLPAAALAISPWADLSCDTESFTTKASEDPALTAAGLRIAAAHYLNQTDPRDPLASPVFADLTGLPPLLIQVGSAEILLDDAVKLAGSAGAAGVKVKLDVWPDMPHVWHAFSFMLDSGRQAIEEAGAFLKNAISTKD